MINRLCKVVIGRICQSIWLLRHRGSCETPTLFMLSLWVRPIILTSPGMICRLPVQHLLRVPGYEIYPANGSAATSESQDEWPEKSGRTLKCKRKKNHTQGLASAPKKIKLNMCLGISSEKTVNSVHWKVNVRIGSSFKHKRQGSQDRCFMKFEVPRTEI